MVWRIDDPQGFESDKVKWAIVPYTRGIGLELGCGMKKAFPHFIGVDNGHHWGRGAADVMVESCADLKLFATGSLDFIFSSHLLEHIEDHNAALKEWWRLLKTGGYLVLYLPHKNFYPNVGAPGANPDHKHDFTPEDIISAMLAMEAPEWKTGWNLVVNEERNQDQEYSFLQVYRKRHDGNYEVFGKRAGKRLLGDNDPPLTRLAGTIAAMQPERPRKTACVVRFGGVGDMIQMGSILPQLKDQGYHLTVMTTPAGQEIVQNDPHVDAWIVQDRDQVPNAELTDYFEYWRGQFDRWINLCESVEASCMAYPGRSQFHWSDRARRAYFGRMNYMRLAHWIADLDYQPNSRFYPSESEHAKALAFRNSLGAGPVIAWSLSGSSFHKAYPWTDSVIARLLMEFPDCRIVLMGDLLCQILEAGWENEPRVMLTSGRWEIRDSLSFAQVADVLIGPETGLLNAMAFEPLAKVLLLSHSGDLNLANDWINTTQLTPEATECWPCHKIHLTRDTCVIDNETGAAACAAGISADRVFNAITGALPIREAA